VSTNAVAGRVESPRFAGAGDLIARALAARVAPAVVVEVGRRDRVVWRQAAGRLTYAADAAPCLETTRFDLASLTKVIASTSIAMRQVVSGTLSLTTRPSELFSPWRSPGHEGIAVHHLLDHSSGLPAYARLWEDGVTRESLPAVLAGIPLEREPGTTAVYSDLGFLLLGAVLETTGRARLDAQFQEFADVVGPLPGYRPAPTLWPAIAPTEYDRWRGRVLAGEVHDENAAALDGVAAHAGLFGTADEVGRFARVVLETFTGPTALGTPDLLRTFVTTSRVPASTRALGWDTMRQTSSCGRRMSPAAIGHTGFTGTSLWIDPVEDVYVVLLTNRVYPTRENNAIREFRPAFHDAVLTALTG